jgi:hypothetical protein
MGAATASAVATVATEIAVTAIGRAMRGVTDPVMAREMARETVSVTLGATANEMDVARTVAAMIRAETVVRAARVHRGARRARGKQTASRTHRVPSRHRVAIKPRVWIK